MGIPKKPFYWMLFRISDDPDAKIEAGRLMIMPNREFWLMLQDEDVLRLSPLRPQIRLDEKLLLKRFDDVLGGDYFVHQGPIQEKK